ncbi:hypothetical protein Asp14428_02940 [Actinoplanes sp. NBRC 14428]|nr:hypothetical protein Asp14428_02940 [Actinoplanes sp. NBRC 14428]
MTTTVPPSAAIRRATACPMPWAAAVTNATLCANRRITTPPVDTAILPGPGAGAQREAGPARPASRGGGDQPGSTRQPLKTVGATLVPWREAYSVQLSLGGL